MEHITKQEDVTVGRIINSLNTLDDENMVTVSDIEPSNPKEGEIWVNPNEISEEKEEKEVIYVGHSIGDIYPVSYTELESGQLVLRGQLVSREIYGVLWAWLQKHPSLLITEQEWNEYFNNTNGLCCPYFSYGTNNTNFRLPNYSGVFIRADSDITKINQFSEYTQRNITGQFSTYRTSWDDGTGELLFGANGAFGKIETGNNMDSIHQDSSDRQQQIVNFDASRSVVAEHTGEEVKPKSINQIWVIQAVGVITNASNLDISQLEEAIQQLTNYSNYEVACIKNNPNYYNRDELFTTNKTTVTIPKNLKININGNGYISTINKSLQLSTVDTPANLAGKDVYIYACEPTSGTEPNFVLSLNSTVPTGYTANNSRKIGGFHCLCKDVGVIEGHTLSGYLKGYILPLSVWDLLHRPVSDSEGMVYIKEINKWVDIYLCSWSGNSLESKFGAVICDGVSATKFHGEGFSEQFRLISKRPLFRNEFATIAKGSNENTSIKNSTDPNTTGGHIDTAGRRMISNYGLEDCCGVLWQWGEDLFDCASAAGISWSSSKFYLNGYSWQTKSVYSPAYDSQTYGSCYGLLRRVLLGAGWCDGAGGCGSRSASCNDFSSNGNPVYSSRGASEPRLVNL